MIAAAIDLFHGTAALARARPRLLFAAAGVLAAAASLAWSYGAGVSAERTRWEARLERQASSAAARARLATQRSSAQAQIDSAHVAASTEELDHADDATPDERPNPKSRAFDCRRLQRAGVSTAGLGCPG